MTRPARTLACVATAIAAVAPAPAAEQPAGAPVLRVPPPAWVAPGDGITGSIIAPRGPEGRDGAPEAGLVRLGDLEAVVRDGLFRFDTVPAGEHLVRLYHESGAGAERARAVLVVPDRPRTDPGREFFVPAIVRPAGDLLVRGPARAGDGELALSIEGRATRLVWATPAAALYGYSVDGQGAVEVSLRRANGAGTEVAFGELHVVRVRWIGPEPETVARRSSEIRFSAEVHGLPAPEESHRGGEPVVEVRYRSLDPEVATSLRSKSKKSFTGEDGVLILPVLPNMIVPGEPVTLAGFASARGAGTVRLEGRLVIPARFAHSSRALGAGRAGAS